MKYKTGFTWILFLMMCMYSCTALAAQPESTESCKSAFQQMERDIASLYLLNDLLLSKDQYKKLSVIIEKSKRESVKYSRELSKLTQSSKELRNAFKRDRKMLKNPNPFGRKTARSSEEVRFHKAEKEFKKDQKKYRDEIRELKHDVKRMLTPAQQKMLDSVKPSFIPIANPTGTLNKILNLLLNPGMLDVVTARAYNRVATLSPSSPYTSYIHKDVLKQYHDDRETARILIKLNLTDKQARTMLPILKKGIEARQRVEYQVEEKMCEALLAYRTLRNELAKGTPSQEREKNANYYHQQVGLINEENIVATISIYEKRIDTLLTAEQIEALSAPQNPGKNKPHNNMEEMDEERKQALRMMNKVRGMSQTQFAQDKSDMTIDFLEGCLESDKEYNDVDIISESDRIAELLTQIRRIDRQEYSQQRENMAIEMCPKLADGRGAKYGHKYRQGQPIQKLDRTTKLLFTPTAFILVEEIAK